MISTPFDEFFRSATKRPSPYDYQCRLACGERNDRADAKWLASGTQCQSQLINIPTGLGKTAAVVLAWLWNRVQLKREDWPRRLAYWETLLRAADERASAQNHTTIIK